MGSLFLGVDGGGSGCRVRLTDGAGRVVGTGDGGPCNIRPRLDEAWAAILGAADGALAQARLARAALSQIHAGLGLAGITTPADAERLRAAGPGFASLAISTDTYTACLGAFAGADGVIVGTGSAGYALISGEHHSIGGWGFEVSDQGSGADIGREAIRAALLAYDGLAPPSNFTQAVIRRRSGPDRRLGRDRAAAQIGALIGRLRILGGGEICLTGGLGPALERWLPAAIRASLVPPRGNAVEGALRLAREAAAS